MLLSNKKELFKKVADEIKRQDNTNCALLGILIFIGVLYPLYFFFKAVFIYINSEYYLLFIFSSIQTIFSILSIIATNGKIHCCCLYNPYQWIFFMGIINTIIMLSDFIIIYLLLYKKNDDDFGYGFWGFFFNVFFVIYLLVIECKIYNKLKVIFNDIRLFETNLAKYCILEFIKELK